MSAAKHTPGPWAVSERYDRRTPLKITTDGPAVAGATKAAEIATLTRLHGVLGYDSANASVMSAAPDMLQLLFEVQDGAYDADPIAHNNWLARVDAAILKATGFAS